MMVQIAEKAINKFLRQLRGSGREETGHGCYKGNGFGLLEVEDIQAEANLRKMKRQQRMQTPQVPSPQLPASPHSMDGQMLQGTGCQQEIP